MGSSCRGLGYCNTRCLATPIISSSKAIKKDFAKVATKYNIKRVQTAVRSDFDKGIRFAEWLGLENEGLMKHYGFDGSDQYRYARIF